MHKVFHWGRKSKTPGKVVWANKKVIEEALAKRADQKRKEEALRARRKPSRM
jgi:hypothetical protein